MKVLFDAMGNPADSGGMNLYARELVCAWSAAFPEDELHVVGGTWMAEAFATRPNVITHLHRGRSIVHRFWIQAIWSGILARWLRCDQLLSLSSLGAFTFRRDHVAVVVHDWRHLRRPQEFGRAQRLYRKLWERSVERAAITIAISPKTAHETAKFARPRRIATVMNGNDHPRHWPEPEPWDAPGPLVLTYGHFVNKRPEAVIQAVAILANSGRFDGGKLVVVGARGEYQRTLQEIAERSGVKNQVSFPGFVPDEDYQALLQQVDVVVLNSSDEGFGLPVSEASYFSIPVVGASDSGLREIHGDRVVISEPTPVALAATIAEQIQLGKRTSHSPHTWADCASEVRDNLESRR